MATAVISVKPRGTLGKKVKQLRRAGIVPANIYGHNVQSTAIEVPLLELRRLIRAAGRTSLIAISIAGERTPRTVLLRGVQRKATTGDLVHVDFQQVSLTETMTIRVPLHFVGEAPAVELGGVVIENLNGVEIQALPNDIPSHIEVDLSRLTALDSQLHVGDLELPANIELVSDASLLVAAVKQSAAEESEAEAEPTEIAAGQEAQPPA